MMSLETIRQLSADAAEHAAKADKRPFVPEASDIKRWQHGRSGIGIPNLGDHEPEGWELQGGDTWFFVDKMGLGAADEPALTLDQFLTALETYRAANPTHGYAIVEEGQFQIKIAPFAPV